MGKKIVPPQDPERLERIMNEKKRQLGVDVAELDRQMASQKQAKYMESARQKLFAHESLECSRMVDRIQQEASYIRQLRNMRTAKLLENQIAEKQMKEYEQKVQSRFTVDNEFLNRFGTSHR